MDTLPRRKYPAATELAADFELARLIANDTKHFLSKVDTRVQTGFRSGFSDAFARPLNVVYPDGRIDSADGLIGRLVDFWKTRIPT